MVTKVKQELETVVEYEVKIPTKQILKTLESYIGIPVRTREVIKMYADYINMYKNKKIKIGNFNIILECNTGNYSDLVKIVGNLLYSADVIKSSDYKLITDVHIGRNNNLPENVLYLISDDTLRDCKLQKLICDNPNCVFMVICTERNFKMIDNVRSNFTWELRIDEPTEKEKLKYIKNIIKSHDFEMKITTKELEAITCFDIPTIESFLIGAFMRATKSNVNYIDKTLLNIIRNPAPNQGMKALNNLIGLGEVKQQLKQILNYVKVHKERGTLPNLHFVFKGNPRNR